MGERPNHIDLPPSSRIFDASRTSTPSPGDRPSPRVGDVPPALSPLDAFALQGRLLARQFEESKKNGNRLSRLPPLTVANEFGKPRANQASAPHSSTPQSEKTTASDDAKTSGTSPEVSRPDWRPQSIHPYMSHTHRESAQLYFQQAEGKSPAKTAAENSTLDAIRAESPEPQREEEPDGQLPAKPVVVERASSPASQEEAPVMITATRRLDNLRPSELVGLAPPRSPRLPMYLRNKPSIRSVRKENGDDSDAHSVMSEPVDILLPERRPSMNSLRSPYLPPFSPPLFAPPRSPSISSEHSATPSFMTRSSVNFSRPLSRGGTRPPADVRPSFESSNLRIGSPVPRPSFDTLTLRDSVDEPRPPSAPWADRPRRALTDDEMSVSSDRGPTKANPAPSYIYAKYSLPRGRVLSKNSVSATDFLAHKFEWSSSATGNNTNLVGSQQAFDDNFARPPLEKVMTAPDLLPERPKTSYGETEIHTIVRSNSASEALSSSGFKKGHRSIPSFPPPAPKSNISISNPSVAKLDTTNLTTPSKPSAARAVLTPATPVSDQLTPEDHLAKGIACHEEGELPKSTYHLRIAARAGLPPAMLLYALACRHGWGMRPNQEEGVQWLRRAVDSAGLEVASDEKSGGPRRTSTMSLDTLAAMGDGSLENKQGKQPSAEGQRATPSIVRDAHRRQLALAIYELGVSYMNGWGIAKDKGLALRCFEIAGSWGDGDALAEAGFCYAKGVGCSKDLKKAADYYRRAEKKGVEMAGNSWIYKAKYMPPEPPADDPDERRSRGRRKGDDDDERGRASSKTRSRSRAARKVRGEGEAEEKEKKPRDKSRTRTFFGGRRRDKDKERERLEDVPLPAAMGYTT